MYYIPFNFDTIICFNLTEYNQSLPRESYFILFSIINYVIYKVSPLFITPSVNFVLP